MADSLLSPVAPVAVSAPSTPVDLRPLTTSELIDRGFSLYRAHFAGFLLLALLCQSAPLLSQVLATAMHFNPTETELLEKPMVFLGKLAVLGTIIVLAQVIVFCFEVVMTFFIADAYLGRIPSVKKSLREFTFCIRGALWTFVLNGLLVLLSFLFPMMAFSATYLYVLFYPPVTFLPLMLFFGVAFVLFIASLTPVLIVFMRLMVTVPALALDGKSGWQAVKRSARLVQYDPGLGFFYWGEMRLSFLLLPLFAIELLILLLTSLPLSLHQLSELMRHGTGGQMAATPESVMIISQIMTFVAGSLIVPLYSIATTLFYYDIRIRREGFDLEFMASQIGERK